MQIHEIHLWTGNLSAQFEFYSGLLKLPVLEQNGRQFAVLAGETALFFHRDLNFSGIYHFAFNIPENLYEEAKLWLLARLPLVELIDGTDIFYTLGIWNSHAMYFRDADNNIVEFIARHYLPNKSSDPFSTEQILSISEIGLPTENVIEQVETFQAQLGLQVFDGAGSEVFTALGDQRGLLIIVQQGRIWFPQTGTPAQIQPVRVVLSNQQNRRFSISGPPYEVTEI